MSENQAILAGSILETYHRYLAPLLFEEYARDLASHLAVPADGRILETACGTGVLTRHLRSSIPPGAHLVVTDLDPAMLEIARKETDQSSCTEYRPADATRLPFEDHGFDAVVCHFGVMFFEDTELGYREAARVLKPGGTFLFNVWDSLERNPLVECAHDVVVSSYPEDPPGSLAVPFAYHDLGKIRNELLNAGFADIEAKMIPAESHAPSARHAARALVAGSPLASRLADREEVEPLLQRVEEALILRFGNGEIRAPMHSFTISARTSAVV